MMKYFNSCKTLEQLKEKYHELVKKYHPDINPDGQETMKEINAEFDSVFPNLKNTHQNVKGEFYEKETNETPESYRDLINKLMNLHGLNIEIIGCFVWVTGETKKNKEALKELGMKWSNNKQAWYKSPKGYKKHNKKQYSMNDIRNRFGVDFEANTDQNNMAAAY